MKMGAMKWAAAVALLLAVAWAMPQNSEDDSKELVSQKDHVLAASEAARKEVDWSNLDEDAPNMDRFKPLFELAKAKAYAKQQLERKELGESDDLGESAEKPNPNAKAEKHPLGETVAIKSKTKAKAKAKAKAKSSPMGGWGAGFGNTNYWLPPPMPVPAAAVGTWADWTTEVAAQSPESNWACDFCVNTCEVPQIIPGLDRHPGGKINDCRIGCYNLGCRLIGTCHCMAYDTRIRL